MGCASSAPRVGPPVGADGLPTEEADEFRPRKRSFLEPEFIRSRAPSELLGFNRSRQSSGNLEFNRSRQPSGGWLRQERYQSPELDTVRRSDSEPPSPHRSKRESHASFASPFPESRVCTLTQRGSVAGAEKPNQDRGLISYPVGGDPQQALLAVLDGHGDHGADCSEFLMLRLPDLLDRDKERLGADATAERSLIENVLFYFIFLDRGVPNKTKYTVWYVTCTLKL